MLLIYNSKVNTIEDLTIDIVLMPGTKLLMRGFITFNNLRRRNNHVIVVILDNQINFK